MDLKQRVARRVEELKQSPFSLATSVGLHRQFINDIIVGRKQTVRRDKLALVAKALQCDESYLTAGTQMPPQSVIAGGGGLLLKGVCQTGVWRHPTTPTDHGQYLEAAADLRFPHTPQVAFLLRGYRRPRPDAVSAIICMERHVFIGSKWKLEGGMTVILQRENSGLLETSLRQVVPGDPICLQSVSWDEAPAQEPVEVGEDMEIEGGEILAIGLCGINFLL